jgi:hypothetical protein
MTFPAKPTTHDLSDLPENRAFPAYNSSMAATNTITKKNPNFGGQGTDSEATHDVVAGDVNWIGGAHDTPELPGPDAVATRPDDVKAGGYGPSARTWKEI